MIKPLTRVAVAASLSSLLAGYAILAQNPPEPDFRKASWGMSQAQALATETDQPVEVRRENGEVVVKYAPARTGDLSGLLIFIFANDKLVRAKYLSDAKHSDLNDFIVDFRAVEPTLMEKYGKPAKERAVWESDLYQQERLPYLDQDRTLPSDILPSDQNAGLAVSLGNLRLITQRGNARTKVIHTLTGEDRRIFHQVEYRSVELEALENKVLQAQ
ncbi:MAG TPA: hypothetical protein VGL82_00120 [Bryobacteraceae bacterium]|jgi:hypothetical protein